MNVLSLFDGMSCGQLALDQLNIKVDKYYASEVDKFAIKVAKDNYPNTIHLGDVKEVKAADLEPIDLLLGGSPCQGFSFAGKQLNFDDPRSALFFEYVRLLKETKPKYFLLENVRMKKEYQDVITSYLGVEPIMINSSLLSAQNRVRLYWTNIPNVAQPEDKGIVLKDILEDGAVDLDIQAGQPQPHPRNYKELGLERVERMEFRSDNKSNSVITNPNKNQIPTLRPCEPREFDENSLCHHVATATDINGHDCLKRVYSTEGKSPTLNACTGGNREPKVLCGAIRGRYKEGNSGETEQRLEIRKDDKTNTLTTVQKDNVLVIKEATKKGYTEIQAGDCFDLTFPNSKTRRGRNMKEKCNCLTATNYDYMVFENKSATKNGKSYALTYSYQGAVAWNSIERKQRTMVPVSQCNIEDPNVVDGYHYRKLTPLECERLQTVPDNYTECVSNTQRYKMLGNGWTIAVVKHILANIDVQ